MMAPGCSPVQRVAPDPKAEGFTVPGAPDFLRPEPLSDWKPTDNLCLAFAEERLAHRRLNSVVTLGRGYMDCVAESAANRGAVKACEAKVAAMAKADQAKLERLAKAELKQAETGRNCGKAGG